MQWIPKGSKHPSWPDVIDPKTEEVSILAEWDAGTLKGNQCLVQTGMSGSPVYLFTNMLLDLSSFGSVECVEFLYLIFFQKRFINDSEIGTLYHLPVTLFLSLCSFLFLF